ncbi:hypothetical protein [Coxiella endosymbiont of Ornithodoros maritimus]|uniref:hypothetical protein n=1 Tax=Coxiella endosymbiont of Ornithodoros maritimus TaxID=1656172 RepID=UPI00226415FA|nr:hypothetical protein [Coxiella endosymbiont of Ornithodoros maritimus]
MNPSQLRETTMNPDTRHLVRLTVKAKDKTEQLLDMLLAKKTRGGSSGLAGAKRKFSGSGSLVTIQAPNVNG